MSNLPEHLCMTRVEYCCTTCLSSVSSHLLYYSFKCPSYHLVTCVNLFTAVLLSQFWSRLRGCPIFFCPCSSFGETRNLYVGDISIRDSLRNGILQFSLKERHKGKNEFTKWWWRTEFPCSVEQLKVDELFSSLICFNQDQTKKFMEKSQKPFRSQIYWFHCREGGFRCWRAVFQTILIFIDWLNNLPTFPCK